MFTAVISAVLFPDKFRITLFIVLAIALLLTGIFCYEKKSLKPATPNNPNVVAASSCDNDVQPLVKQNNDIDDDK